MSVSLKATTRTAFCHVTTREITTARRTCLPDGVVWGEFGLISSAGSALAYHPRCYAGGRFVVVGVLGTGAHGYTLLVHDRRTGAPGALKGRWWGAAAVGDPQRARVELARRNTELLRATVAARQADAHAAGRHPGIPRVLAGFTQPAPTLLAAGIPRPPRERFVVQEFVGHGGRAAPTLRQRLDRDGPPEDLPALARALCGALAALHAAGWLHTDLTPANVLVANPRRYLLADLDGVVRPGCRPATTSHRYCPPPTPDGQPLAVDAGFDLYMLAVTLYEAASGQPPDQDLRALLYGGPADRREGRRRVAATGCGRLLTELITACMAVPDRRPAAVSALRDAVGTAGPGNRLWTPH